MSQYQQLDEAILERLATTGHRTGRFLIGLSGGDVGKEARRLAELSGREDFRIVDGRLQALRRAGKIAFNSKTGWSSVEAA